MILIAVSATTPVAMLTAVGFGFLGAVVDEDGTVNHIQSIFSVYPHRDPYPPSNAQGYAVRRHDDAVLRGAVGAEDDGARVVIHISRLRQWLCNLLLGAKHQEHRMHPS